MSFIKHPIHTLKFTTSTYAPMQRINIDTINMDRVDENGNQHVIVIIDCFSRWVELYAVPDLSALSAANSLLQFIGRYGLPEQIQADQGTQYVNQLIEELCKMLGSDYAINTTPYSKEENAMVERANKEVMRHLRALIFHKNIISEWSNNLPIVQRIINSSEHESIGVSPVQILFGNISTYDRSIFLPSGQRPEVLPSDNPSYSHWLASRLQAQDLIISEARKNQMTKDDNHMSTTPNNITQFNENDYVLVEYPPTNLKPGPPSKLMTNLRGPMKVIGMEQSTYILQDLVTNKNEKVHVKRIHPFYYDPNVTNPREIANKDQQAFDIDRIMEHRGNKYQTSTLKFKVLWMPVNNQLPEITWEPYKSLRSTAALHKYLNENKLKMLIPAVYK